MQTTDYTSYAEIRAVLGVSTTELTDAVLAQPQWYTVLITELEDINIDLPNLFETVSAKVLANPTTASTDEKRFYDLTRLYASHILGWTLITSLPMFSVKDLTDGKAGFGREVDAFKDVRDGLEAMYLAIKSKLSLIFLKLEPTTIPYDRGSFAYTVSTGVGTSPITNT